MKAVDILTFEPAIAARNLNFSRFIILGKDAALLKEQKQLTQSKLPLLVPTDSKLLSHALSNPKVMGFILMNNRISKTLMESLQSASKPLVISIADLTTMPAKNRVSIINKLSSICLQAKHRSLEIRFVSLANSDLEILSRSQVLAIAAMLYEKQIPEKLLLSEGDVK